MHPKVIRERRGCSDYFHQGITGCSQSRNVHDNPTCNDRTPEVVYIPVYPESSTRGRGRGRYKSGRGGRGKGGSNQGRKQCSYPQDSPNHDMNYSQTGYVGMVVGGMDDCGVGRCGVGSSRGGFGGRGRCLSIRGGMRGDTGRGGSCGMPCLQLFNSNVHHAMPDQLCPQTESALARYLNTKKTCFRKVSIIASIS